MAKRVRFSGYGRCESVQRVAGLWMRVDGATKILAFDNLHRQRMVGTRDWREYAIVLPIAEESVTISFGILLDGRGQVWFNGLKWDVVGDNVPLTDYSPGISKAFQEQANLALHRYDSRHRNPELLPTRPGQSCDGQRAGWL